MTKSLAKTQSFEQEFTPDFWRTLTADVLSQAKALGASSAEAAANMTTGFNVSVRLGDVETVEYNRDKMLGITVYFGQRKGSASTSDTTPAAIEACVKKACEIAKQTGEDECAGLADAKLLAESYPDLQLWHPWAVDTEQGIELAKQCEQLALAQDSRIQNSEGAQLSTHQSFCIYSNSHGFVGSYPTSMHNLSCSLIAKDDSGMQTDYGYTVARDAADLYSAQHVAELAAQRTVARLGSRPIKTCQVPVIFSARVARGFLGHFFSAIRGSQLYRKSSFLVDHLNKPVFPAHMQMEEKPHLLKGLGSAPFDYEGVSTKEKAFVTDGILQSYVLASYSARKLGMQTTGNAGGAHNVFVKTSDLDLTALLKQMHTGLLVTEVMGQGINLVTGDYSRGAAGFWVENGEIQFPVEEVTIAGNLKDLFMQIVAVANDVEPQSSIQTGSLLIEKMMVAGQ